MYWTHRLCRWIIDRRNFLINRLHIDYTLDWHNENSYNFLSSIISYNVRMKNEKVKMNSTLYSKKFHNANDLVTSDLNLDYVKLKMTRIIILCLYKLVSFRLVVTGSQCYQQNKHEKVMFFVSTDWCVRSYFRYVQLLQCWM